MVQKFGKFGVRSGNSLKASNSKYLRRYRRDAVVFRETVNLPNPVTSQDTILGQTDVLSNEVPYSLNKKGRWSLPEEIKRAILTGELRREEFGVQLVELHKINKAANCVAVYASRGPFGKLAIQKRKNKRHRKRTGYMQAKSIINAKPHGTSNRRRRHLRRRGITTGDENTEEVNEPSQIRYEVVYPSPVTSSVTHNPKYIGHDTTKVRARTGHKRHRRKHQHDLMYEEIYDMDEQFDDSEEEDCYHDNEYSYRDFESDCVSIEDIAKHAVQIQTRFFRQKSSKKQRKNSRRVKVNEPSNKSNIIYDYCLTDEQLPAESNDTDKEVAEGVPVKQVMPVCEPVLVCLKASDVDPTFLQEAYGDKYIEAACVPRKFIIDISETANDTKLLQNRWKKCPDRLNASVVFVSDVYNEVNTQKEHIYKVQLNTSVCRDITSMKIETLFDYMETTVADCLRRSLFYMETITEHLHIGTTNTVYSKTTPSKTEELANWKTMSYIPNNTYVYKAFLEISQRHATNDDRRSMLYRGSNKMDDPQDISFQTSRFCGICYETLGTRDPGTSLISCGHWFCDICWKEYLETQARSGATSLVCPEFDCNTMVDPGTTMSILNMKDIIRFAKCCHDTKVEQQVVTKWCPNEQCGRVIKVNSEKTEIVNCDCGQNLCFKCNQKSHWPASCQDAKWYYKKLKELGLEDVKSEETGISSINGRECPVCKRFVEKDGGCPYMYCICRNAFCWGCGKVWNSAQHGGCYTRGQKNVHNGTTKKRIKAVPKRLDDGKESGNTVQQLFNAAVEHRFEQQRARGREMKVASKELSKRLQPFVTRSVTRDENINNYSGLKIVHETGKIYDFINQMVSLYSEINHIAEHIAIILINIPPTEANKAKFLKHVMGRLQCLSTTINESIIQGQNFHPREVIQRLADARFHSLKGIKALLRRV